MAPRFSVVIPTFNHAEFLRNALRSVLEQSFTDFDIWVINNLSTDHTVEVVNGFNDPRIHLMEFSNNGIIGASRNVGTKASSGDYVAFLDSDDVWHANKLETVSKAIADDPEAGVICHSQMILREGRQSGTVMAGPPKGRKGELFDYWVRNGNTLTPSAAVVRRQSLESVGGFSEDPSLATVEDTDLWLRLAKDHKFVFLPDILGDYNMYPNSSSANVELHLSGSLTLIDRHWNSYRPNGRSLGDAISIQHQRSNAYFGAARQYQRAGNFRKPLAYFAKALSLYPFHLRSVAAAGLLIAGKVLGVKWSVRLTDALWRSGTRRKMD